MEYSTAHFHVLHYLPEFAQTYAHWVNDVIGPSHPLLPLFFLPSIFPASESFSMNWLFPSGGQSIGALASASGLFALGLNGLILLSKALPESSPASQFKWINSSALSLLYGPTLTLVHDYQKNQSLEYMNLLWLYGPILTIQTFVSEVMSLLFNTLSSFVIAFLPKSKQPYYNGCSNCPQWF